jgi:hypothetical protein
VSDRTDFDLASLVGRTADRAAAALPFPLYLGTIITNGAILRVNFSGAAVQVYRLSTYTPVNINDQVLLAKIGTMFIALGRVTT